MARDDCLLKTNYKVLIESYWSNPGIGVCSSLHLGVITIEKGAFESPSTIVRQLNYLYKQICGTDPKIRDLILISHKIKYTKK